MDFLAIFNILTVNFLIFIENIEKELSKNWHTVTSQVLPALEFYPPSNLNPHLQLK